MKVTFDRGVFIFGAGQIADGQEVDIPEKWAAPHLGGENPRARIGWNLAPVGPPATDAAIQLAKKHGFDLATVTPTGQGGKITKGDVEAALAAGEE